MDTRDVLDLWQEITGAPLAERWRAEFLAREETGVLATFPYEVVARAGQLLVRQQGKLKLDAWLRTVRARSARSTRRSSEASRRERVDATVGALAPARTAGRAGKSPLNGQVWSAPVDTDLHKRISAFLGERPQYE